MLKIVFCEVIRFGIINLISTNAITMKEYKNSALVRKELISPAYYDQFFNYLSSISSGSIQYRTHLKDKLTGYYSKRNPYLLKADEICDKCWFISKGIVFAFYYDQNHGFSVHTIFEAGEIAMLPDSFMTGEPGNVFLMACPDTHLLEINAVDVEDIYEQYPERERITEMILAYQGRKYQERDRLLRFIGKDLVIEFYRVFPGLQLTDKKMIMQKVISSYLMLSGPRLSKLRREIMDEQELQLV
ncbi:hypothetical protein D3C87_226770 [compost metagenome]